jgi:hypothetical protein
MAGSFLGPSLVGHEQHLHGLRNVRDVYMLRYAINISRCTTATVSGVKVTLLYRTYQRLLKTVTVLPSTGASSTCVKVSGAQAEQGMWGRSAQVRMG